MDFAISNLLRMYVAPFTRRRYFCRILYEPLPRAD